MSEPLRTLVARDGKVIPGREDLFKKLVEKNKLELQDAHRWCMEKIPSYLEADAKAPVLDWDKESEENLFTDAVKFGDGSIYFTEEE